MRELFSQVVRFLPGIFSIVLGYGWFVLHLSVSFFREDAYTWQFYKDWVKRQGLQFDPHQILVLAVNALLSVLVWFLVGLLAKSILLVRPWLLWLRISLLVILLWSIHVWAGPYNSLWLYRLLHFLFFPEGLFWLVAAIFLVSLYGWLRSGYRSSGLMTPTLCFYGLALGGRILSKAELSSYAIYYNAGLFLVFLVLLAWIGQFISKNLNRKQQKTICLALCVLEGVGLFAGIYPWRVMSPALLRTERGIIYTSSSEAELFPSIIQFIRENDQQGNRVLVLPEETSLYFFAGEKAPSRWYMIHPGLLNTEKKEARFLDQVESQHVKYILLSNRSFELYGHPYLGRDYNPRVYQWIQENFDVVGQFGVFSRETPTRFGMLIYQRRSISTPTRQPCCW